MPSSSLHLLIQAYWDGSIVADQVPAHIDRKSKASGTRAPERRVPSIFSLPSQVARLFGPRNAAMTLPVSDHVAPTEMKISDALLTLMQHVLVYRLAYNGDVVAFKMGRRQGGPSRTGVGAYLNRYVTDEQRRRRPIFNATLRAAASWLFFRVACSARMDSDMGTSLAP